MSSDERRVEPVTDGRGRDRQILVAGNDLAAAATAGFLEQAGLDPVLAATTNERARPEVVTIWQPGLALLERIGLRRPVERLGTAIDDLTCLTSGESWSADDGRRPSLVAVRRGRLQDLLDGRLFGRIRTAERAVTAVEPTEAGVTATFEQGIDEAFDTVVTTARSLVPVRDPVTPGTPIHTWEFEWPATTPAPDGPTEAWDDALAAFTVPVTGGTVVRLVAATETDPAAAVSIDELASRFGHLFESLESPFAGLDQHGLQYSRTPPLVPESMCLGGVALVGPTAHATIPGDCLGPALGIEDAWVLADTLAYGPPAIGAALADYETRRRRRASDLNAIFHDGGPAPRVPSTLSPRLQQLCASRTLAFSHVLDRHPPEFASAVPDRL